MSDTYSDSKIDCDDTSLHIRGYYFPYGTKTVSYSSIKGIRRFQMSGLRGKGRIWGTGNFKYWANLDTHRPRKSIGFILDVGKSVSPFVTPDNPDEFASVLASRTGLSVTGGDGEAGPLV